MMREMYVQSSEEKNDHNKDDVDFYMQQLRWMGDGGKYSLEKYLGCFLVTVLFKTFASQLKENQDKNSILLTAS